MKKRTTIKWTVGIMLLCSATAFMALARQAGWWKEPEQHTYDAKQEFLHLSDAYMGGHTTFDVAGTISLYDMEHKNALKEVSSFRSIKTEQGAYSRLAGQQTFVYDNLLVQLDSTSKSIMVTRIDTGSSSATMQSGFPLAQYINDTSLFHIHATVSGDDKERVLNWESDMTPDIKSIRIYYRPQDYSIIRQEVIWWKASPALQAAKEDACWLSVIYLDQRPGASFPILEEMNKVVQVQQQKVVAMAPYKDYDLTISMDQPVANP